MPPLVRTPYETALTRSRVSDRALALLVLAGAMVLSTIALLWIGRDQTIHGDDLAYATRIATQGLSHALLHTPANKYLIAVPLVVYRVLFSVFGLNDYFPPRLLAVALVLTSGGLFYALVRQHVGYVLALLATVMLLFFG